MECSIREGHLVQVSHFTDGEIEARGVKGGTVRVKGRKKPEHLSCKEVWELGAERGGLREVTASYSGYTQRGRQGKTRHICLCIKKVILLGNFLEQLGFTFISLILVLS